MGFFNNISKTITDVGQSTIQKGRDFADTTKLNSQISDEEKKIAEQYEQIGKLYYETHADDAEEGFKGFIDEINASKAKIAELNAKVTEIKGEGKCPNCGAAVPAGSMFCSSCGAKIETEEPKQEEAPAKFCASCGAKLSEGMKFCTSCGAPVAADESDSTAE